MGECSSLVSPLSYCIRFCLKLRRSRDTLTDQVILPVWWLGPALSGLVFQRLLQKPSKRRLNDHSDSICSWSNRCVFLIAMTGARASSPTTNDCCTVWSKFFCQSWVNGIFNTLYGDGKLIIISVGSPLGEHLKFVVCLVRLSWDKKKTFTSSFRSIFLLWLFSESVDCVWIFSFSVLARLSSSSFSGIFQLQKLIFFVVINYEREIIHWFCRLCSPEFANSN